MKVGLMGFGRRGERLAHALIDSSWCDLVAVGSPKSKYLTAFAEEHPDIAICDDFRALMVSNPLDALFIACPPFVRGKYLSLAAERGLPVWMVAPAARRFDEACNVARQFDQAGQPIVVERGWAVDPALHPDAVGLDGLGRLFFARGNVMTCEAEDLDWRGDSVRAGGGVLLESGYGLVDMLVNVMGLPSTVFAAAKGVSRPGGQFPYDTEDTAALTCQFSNGAIAVLSACWTAGPPHWVFEAYGIEGSIRVEPSGVSCRDRSGEGDEHSSTRSANPYAPMVEDFLSGLAGNRSRLGGELDQHLDTMAVIQAAYLSARTGQPESPSTIFKMHAVKAKPGAVRHSA